MYHKYDFSEKWPSSKITLSKGFSLLWREEQMSRPNILKNLNFIYSSMFFSIVAWIRVTVPIIQLLYRIKN